MTKDEIAKKILKYIAWRDHYIPEPGEEAYHFGIKVYRIKVPELVRKLLPSEQLSRWYSQYAFQQLTRFAEELKEGFSWIKDWYTAGRMGGWLVLVTDEPALDQFDELGVSWKEGMRRLRDLQEIDRMVIRALERFVRGLETLDPYRDIVPGITKRWAPDT
jgi:hypothetical protein